MSELEAIIFDQYSRYRACAEMIAAIGAESGSELLDIGSGPECLLGHFLPASAITYVDPLLADVKGRNKTHIGADVFSPNLDNRRFDYVASVDTLEHVPASKRAAFIERLSSLARSGLVIGFPCADRGDAVMTDHVINEHYRQLFGRDYPWLEEHIRYSLPRLADVLDQLRSCGWHCKVIGHGHAPWLRELLGFVTCAWDVPEAQDIVLEISRRFNCESASSFSARAERLRSAVN